ncbi:MAG: hypothetical protein J6C01_11265 [Lachnospiraceae bacterium]|nr:hypothetical protein [Lachnospiraceae bacterium]
MDESLNEKEIIDNTIQTYCNLQRIKHANEGVQNKELDYQLKIAKAKLEVFGVNLQELEY